MTTDKPTQLRIPEQSPEDTIGADLAYAECGWYVLPIDQATKHSGSVLGNGWPAKSSRDEERIVRRFAGTNCGLALHLGRSCAVAFDSPGKLPQELVARLMHDCVPFESTHDRNLRRGHYLFATPADRIFGNSNGDLVKDWGDIRGADDIIVGVPTVHQKADEGGGCHWVRTGALPILPSALSDRLWPPATSVDVTILGADITRLPCADRPYRGPAWFSAPPVELHRRSHPRPIRRSRTRDTSLSIEPSIEVRGRDKVRGRDITDAATSLTPDQRDKFAHLLRPAPHAADRTKRWAS